MSVSAVSSSKSAVQSSSSRPTLRQGSRGSAVVTLQQRLRALGYNIAADGVFGPKTRAAVIAFQRAKGLATDGIVGPKTWAKLLAAPGTASSSAKATTSSQPTLRLGAKGTAVKTLQNRLRAHGYNIAADGAFGPKTLAAVKAFQRAKGLAADGVVGPKTWAKLLAAPAASAPKPSGGSGPTLRQGARGNPVKQLQNRLNALGFKVGTADGIFGPKTLAAVKAFQKSRGLAVDGVVGPKTWAKLGIHASGSVTYPSSGGTSGGTTVTGYVNGVPRKIKISKIPGGKYLRSDAAAAFTRMYEAARKAGITLNVNSAFRTMEQQRYLYNLYLQGKGNLAAKPGYSNHQGGIAVDIQVGTTSSKTYKWLAANAAKFGFRRTVPSEPWHWEYRP